MRILFSSLCLLALGFAVVQAKPAPKDKKDEPKTKSVPAFKPISVEADLTQQDGNDAKLNHPARTFNLKFEKDKTYIIELASKDFDAFLRVLDKNGNELAMDDDGGGDLDARIIFSAAASDDYKVVATTFDGNVGKYAFKVREFQLTRTEKKPREVGKEGLTINDQIAQADASDVGKLAKTYSVQLKAGQTYAIELESNDIDSYLYLFDARGKKLAEDDDSGGDVNSRIVFRAPNDGVYHVIATSLDGNETGAFGLRVRQE